MSPMTADKDYMTNFYEVFRKRCAARKAADQRNNESRSQNLPDGKDPKIDEPYKVHKTKIRRRRRPEKRRRRKPARELTIGEINETLHRIIGPRLDIVERKLANIRLEGDPRAAMFKEPGAGRDRRGHYPRRAEQGGVSAMQEPHSNRGAAHEESEISTQHGTMSYGEVEHARRETVADRGVGEEDFPGEK
ncbi:hypothetical protein IF1G_03857 [Cordyceps javanica]|uniref:Uncharacterized protein n=1 Tax=Cordyceps javanica TaxID=43265 RepID=A0A545V8Q5_9HYPO|nr:hypothetical protein IF1G_03857 [Cordyceps javanica]